MLYLPFGVIGLRDKTNIAGIKQSGKQTLYKTKIIIVNAAIKLSKSRDTVIGEYYKKTLFLDALIPESITRDCL